MSTTVCISGVLSCSGRCIVPSFQIGRAIDLGKAMLVDNWTIGDPGKRWDVSIDRHNARVLFMVVSDVKQTL